MIWENKPLNSKNRQSKKRKKLTILLFAVVLMGFTYWFIPPVWRLNGNSIMITQYIGNQSERQVEKGPVEKEWLRIDNVSQYILNAVIVAEDGRFYQHHGLDFTEIEKSISKNLRKGRLARGASTLTQQVVKMAFLTREKSFIRKAREAVGALILEIILEKDSILEWYVNLAEFGDGVYGIGDASWHYFQIEPDHLTIQQAIHLALILPSPKKWSTGLRQKDLTDFGHQRFAQLAGHLRQGGYITVVEWLNILKTANFGGPLKNYDNIVMQFLESEN
jgi:monofunctional glycosyltransferase